MNIYSQLIMSIIFIICIFLRPKHVFHELKSDLKIMKFPTILISEAHGTGQFADSNNSYG